MSVGEKILNPEITVDFENHVDLIINAKSNPNIASGNDNSSRTVRISKVEGTLRKPYDYEEYYVPKAVSIGPYHFGKQKLESVQNLKPYFTNKLVEGNPETLTTLYNKLGEMVQDLKGYYDEDFPTRFSDMEFTNMRY